MAAENEHQHLLREAALLYGRKLTVYRAELPAAIAAVAMADKSVIFTQNAAVAAAMTRLLAGEDSSFWETHPDRDLWHLASQVYNTEHACNITIHWTKAHRKLCSAISFHDVWHPRSPATYILGSCP